MDSKLRMLVALLAVAMFAAACQAEEGDTNGPTTTTFQMTDPDVAMTWVVTAPMEEACGAPRFAGGEIEGSADFGDLGRLDLVMSAAWDISEANPNADESEYEPESEHTGGPFAPVLSGDDYPYAFVSSPFPSMGCGPSETATGELELSSADGDTIAGVVTGGETHRLDVNIEGDGIETFVEIEFTGGTGAFAGASGSAVLHLITHVDPAEGDFVIDVLGVLEGGTVTY